MDETVALGDDDDENEEDEDGRRERADKTETEEEEEEKVGTEVSDWEELVVLTLWMVE